MASKGPRSKLDHESRARRQKALEAPREPRRPKTHWDHVLEEMVWLSKDFESERKWKLAQAKKVALKASKGMLDQASRGEKKLKEEEQRLRKVAVNISKDVKKFWTKIEKLVLYKHQMELDERKKKALDKQLEFLLGQTERYSTMLAENLVDSQKPVQQSPVMEQPAIQFIEADENNAKQLGIQSKEVDETGAECNSGFDNQPQIDAADVDEDYGVQSEDVSEDDEQTIEEDEALITAEERKEELEALQNETDIPLEELLKRYTMDKVNRKSSPEMGKDEAELTMVEEGHTQDNRNDLPVGSKLDISSSLVRRCDESNGGLSNSGNHLSDIDRSQLRDSYDKSGALTEKRPFGDFSGERDESNGGLSISEDRLLDIDTSLRKDSVDRFRASTQKQALYDFSDEQEDGDFVAATGEDKDDETTLSDEEELAKEDSDNHIDEIALLQKESEIPVEELLARYRKEMNCNETSEDDSDYASALSEDLSGSPAHEDSELKLENNSVDGNVDPAENQLVLHPLTEEQEEGSEKKSEEGKESENRIADAAAAARSAQPTGITFSTTKVRTKFPFLLKFPLREYQHIGLDWLVTLYEKRLNGILADEMGLGKTIMTIAMLAHVACEKGIWGPHLIVVPTSVMLNWETEFLKWCPAFKILTYFGSAKERKFKRQGWLKPNSFHVCITTYRLVIQDCKVFKRKKWKYLILDEAHLIKNWKSQRWQTLLNFNSKRRILLTGTPLQNDLMELWSLMHFLMPHIFQSHQEFKDWFVNPISGMVEGQEKVNKEVVDRLHSVLRPFILRRLKRDVEKQLPMKVEHVINCRLSKRQRNLYEDFIARAETQATLASANFFGMISVIMQLRKVCNHPDLFEGRPIVSSFDLRGIEIQLSSSVCSILSPSPLSTVDLKGLGLVFTDLDFTMNSWESDEVNAIAVPRRLIKEQTDLNNLEEVGPFCTSKRLGGPSIFEEIRKAILEGRRREARDRADTIAWWNSLRCQKKPVYSTSLRELLTVERPVSDILRQKSVRLSYLYSSKLADIVLSPVERFQRMIDLVESFMFVIPAARAPIPDFWCSKGGSPVFLHPTCKEKCSEVLLPLLSPIRPAIVRRQVYFPDRRLIQFDCGKLQELALLLRKLKSEGHRALIFTQMTKMLDILEAFISLYGYTYMRLDGSTQPEERQTLMQRFNSNPKIFLFILSTRSGGVGINLVGADTVIFYDSDWNPAMDQQAQDRCHRIGQTREVHIYRLISESTIEENILKKANQKRALDDLVIQSGGYNTEFFKKLDPMELFSGLRTLPVKNIQKEKTNSDGHEASLSNADVEAALKCVEDEADYMALKRVEQEDAVDDQEFTEEAIGRLEDDELVNEDHVKTDEPTNQGGHMTTNNDIGLMPTVSDPKEERTLAFASKDDDADMLADVKQMAAAAAAAGEAISSFENQLRPIDRYAIRFLELWDPIIDKTAVESEINFEETEWELDRIEKYKEEMEADIDDDEEPFVYESWDADFATEAYRQQVAIAQHQLMEELESAAKEKEDADDENLDYVKVSHSKPKTKKKPKKAKFKSLKKGALTSESKAAKEEPSVEPMSIDDDFYSEDATFSDAMSPTSTSQKKRKNAELAPYDDEESEKSSKKKSKKLRKALPSRATDLDCKLLRKRHDGFTERRTCESMVVDLEHKSASRSKMGGKISITSMPVKRVLMIKPEKVKKGNVWSRDYVPSPDVWLPQEDAILCAVVHEYGPNWCLVSETLYGMTAGGFYRGRYRHPVHCCERFRELIQQYILSAPDNSINEKISNVGSGKALLKVTEDNIRMLLKIAAEQEDNELLLQKHFTALLSSVWRIKSRTECRQNASSSLSGLYLGGRFFSSSVKQTSCSALLEPPRTIKFVNLGQSSKLLSAALNDANRRNQEFSVFKRREVGPVITEKLDLNLVFEREWVESMDSFPPQVDLSIYHSDPSTSVSKFVGEDCHLKDSQVAENRFRDAARACTEDSLVWAASTFPANDAKLRPVPKSQSLGKHKLPLSDSIKSPKSKLRKTLIDHSEILQLSPEPVPTQAVFLKDPDLRFDMTEEAGLVDLDGNLLLDMDQEFSRETSLSNVIPHNYSPDVISGLNDCSILPDYTDFG